MKSDLMVIIFPRIVYTLIFNGIQITSLIYDEHIFNTPWYIIFLGKSTPYNNKNYATDFINKL